MDDVSGSVSSLIFPSKSNNAIHTDHNSHFNSCKPIAISTSPDLVVDKTKFTFPFLSSSRESPSKQFHASTTIHLQAASSGYAAALVDVARSTDSLKPVAKDVDRLSNCLRKEQLSGFIVDPWVGEMEKGEVLVELAEKGRFHRHLVVMLKFIVSKNKLGQVNDVFTELQRIYDELIGTCVVVVSSARQMSKDKLFSTGKGSWKTSRRCEGEGKGKARV